MPILNLNGGHVCARSEHVFVVAHEKQSSSSSSVFSAVRMLRGVLLALYGCASSVLFIILISPPSPFLQKKSGVVKSQEKKERWKEKKVAKRQKKEDEEAVGEEENVQPAVDPLENGFLHHAQREQERMNERLLKKTYSKKNKMVSPSAPRTSSLLFVCLFVSRRPVRTPLWCQTSQSAAPVASDSTPFLLLVGSSIMTA